MQRQPTSPDAPSSPARRLHDSTPPPSIVSRRSPRRGVLLLEVVLSLTILVIAMGVIGMAFNNGQKNVLRSERMIRGMLMTERIIAELDTNLLDMTERDQSGYFRQNEAIPGMSWRVEINPSDRVTGLLDIDVYIYMGDPDGTEEDHQLILATRLQRAEPRGIDFQKDFGLDEDQIQQLTDAIPGGTQLLDPTNFDPRSLAQLDLDTLVELLPTIIQAFGANLGQGQLDQIIQAVQSGDTGTLQSLAGQQAGQLRGLGGGSGTNNPPPANGPGNNDGNSSQRGGQGRRSGNNRGGG